MKYNYFFEISNGNKFRGIFPLNLSVRWERIAHPLQIQSNLQKRIYDEKSKSKTFR